MIRHTLSRDLYDDVDMVNPHPCILMQLCARHHIPCRSLNDYVAHRDVRLQELTDCNGHSLSRCDAKKTVLAILNGGLQDYENISHKPEWLVRFVEETSAVLRKLSVCYPDELLFRRKLKKGNYDASTVNSVMCDIESQCLMAAVQFLESRGFHPDALVFDGLMVRKDSHRPLTSAILADMSDAVSAATGFHIVFDIKPMDKGVELPVDYGLEVHKTMLDGLLIEKTHYDMAMIVQRVLGDTFVCALGKNSLRLGG